MKKKFLQFVKENWAKSEWEWAEWDSVEKFGTVQFRDGNEAHFEYEDDKFLQAE